MKILIYVALYGFIPLMLGIFAAFPARRAMIAGFLIAWMFLPMAVFSYSGLPDYDKTAAASLGILLGMMFFDTGRLSQLRFTACDLPMLIWCIVPFLSSLTAGLGLYDGISSTLRQIITWGIPYFVGRLYFRSAADLRDLTLGFYIGGLVYMPFCLYEIKMSPVLHYKVYGFTQHVFAQTRRFGGWRPMVFMQHGLAVGMWMTSACLAGIWLWGRRQLPKYFSFPPQYLLIGLLITTVLCKSTGAIVLLLVGTAALFWYFRFRSTKLLLLLTLMPVFYIGARTIGGWSGSELVSLAEQIDETRAESLRARIYAEGLILNNSYRRPLFGWGYKGWSNFESDSGAVKRATPDGFWLIAAGRHGFVGLMSVYLMMLLPTWYGLSRLKRLMRRKQDLGSDVPLFIVLLSINAIDCLFNAMLNPLFTLLAGGLISLVLSPVPRAATRTVRVLQPHQLRFTGQKL